MFATIMERRDFIRNGLFAGAAALVPNFLHAQGAKAEPKLYGTKASLDGLPVFARDNLTKWAGIDIITATKSDVVFKDGVPQGFTDDFHGLLKSMRIDAATFFKISELRGGRPSRRPPEQVLAINLVDGRYSVRGFSRANLADADGRRWDAAFILSPEKTLDTKHGLSLFCETPEEFLEHSTDGEMLWNIILAHETAHMVLRREGKLVPEVSGLYCGPGYVCHDENGLFDKSRGQFYSRARIFPSQGKPLLNAKLASEAITIQNSIANQAEYFCDQFAINVCRPAGLTEEDAITLRNARSIGGIARPGGHITAYQLDVRGKIVDPAELQKLVMTNNDPMVIRRSLNEKRSTYLFDELKLSIDQYNQIGGHPPAIYSHYSEMLEKGKFTPAEAQMVEQFLQAGRDLAPRMFGLNAPRAAGQQAQPQQFDV